MTNLNNFVRFTDCFHPRLLEVNEEFKSFEDKAASETKGLKVVFEATHSGIVNNNLRFYIPSLMREGTKTFMKAKKTTKILKHHNSDSDPVGIITGAEYIETIPEELKDNPDVKILVDSTSSIKKKLKAAKNFIKTGIPLSKDFAGLGYIKLYGIVSDSKSVEQLEDKRFDAVSTSFISPDGVFCSECHKNLLIDGRCEHSAGESYEDDDGNKIVCSLIPAVHDYKEVSLVVFDADPFTVVEIVQDSDDIKTKFVYNLNVDKENCSETDFSKSTCKFNDSKEDGMTTPKELSDNEKKVFDEIKKLRPDMNDEDLNKFAIKLTSLKKDGFFPFQQEAELDDDTAFLYTLEDLETEGQEVNADEVYSGMEKELTEDAKLSTEARKKLGSSTFCGPNRSFPVPDCAHVTAARRLIGRYKGPGNKSSILACVSRKAKALGCDSGDSNIPTPEGTDSEFRFPTCDDLKGLSDDNAKILFAMSETELIGRNLKVSRECSKCAESADRLEVATKERDEAIAEFKSLKSQLDALRYELRFYMKDYEVQVDKVTELLGQIRDEKIEKASIVSVLSGKHKDKEEAITSFSDSEITDLDKVISDFDFIKAATKLNDGMDHDPEGTVNNPGIDDTEQNPGLSTVGKTALENIKNCIKDGDIYRAETIFNTMLSCEIFPDSMKFESLVDENTKE